MRFTANFHDDGASFDASASETGSSFDAQITDGHASFDAKVSTGAEKFPASVQDNNSAFGVNFTHYVENNTGGGGGAAVLYTPMELNEDQKQQARDNIGAIDRGFEMVSVFAREDGTYFANVAYTELIQQLAAGKALYAMLDGVRYPLVQSVGTWLYFGKLNLPSGTGTTWHYTYIGINSSNKVLVTKPQIPITAITLTGLDRKKLVYVNRDNELESLELDEAMRVENGTLLLDDAIKHPGIIVNIMCDENMENWTADKRHADLWEAARQGLPVYANILGIIAPVQGIEEGQAYFVVEFNGIRLEVIIDQADPQDIVTGSFGAAGSSVLVVRATGELGNNQFSVSHTSDEIADAVYTLGQAVVFALGDGLYTLSQIDYNQCIFSTFNADTVSSGPHLGYKESVTITGDVATWKEVALRVELHPLTINGVEYDGSEAVEVNVKGSGPGGSLIVNFTYSDDGETLIADKTFTELHGAVAAGTMLFADVEGKVYPLIDWYGLALTFGAYERTAKGLVKHEIKLRDDDTVTYTDVQVTIDTIRFPSFSGKMLYVDSSGRPRPLKLGTGLKIENGVLMLDGTVTPDTPSKTAICGTILAGQVLCGEGV